MATNWQENPLWFVNGDPKLAVLEVIMVMGVLLVCVELGWMCYMAVRCWCFYKNGNNHDLYVLPKTNPPQENALNGVLPTLVKATAPAQEVRNRGDSSDNKVKSRL
jgi:hypothetical protein